MKRLDPNARLALICAAAFFGMVAAAYASVPLYRLFCQATGFDGTVRRAEAAPDQVIDRTVRIRFDANVNRVPWRFTAERAQAELRLGETGLAFFRVTNTSQKPVTARAAYNVLPEQAGAYFQKLECFCFTDQTLKPGETREFPVAYFVDPRLATDPETRGVGEITLSYTFFPSQKSAGRTAALGVGAAERL